MSTRPALFASSFLRPHASNHSNPNLASEEDAYSKRVMQIGRVGQHYQPHEYSQPISTRLLLQPLFTPSGASSSSSSSAHSSATSFGSTPPWLQTSAASSSSSSSATRASNPSEPQPVRDVLHEIGAPFSLFQSLNLISGSLVELQSTSAAAPNRVVLAKLVAVQINQQAFQRCKGDPAFSTATATTSAANQPSSAIAALLSPHPSPAASSSAAEPHLILLPPSLQFHLFSADTPAATDATFAVRLRKFLPAVPVSLPQHHTHDHEHNNQQLLTTLSHPHHHHHHHHGRDMPRQSVVHQLHETAVETIPKATSVTIARVRTPISTAVEGTRQGSSRLLAAIFSNHDANQAKNAQQPQSRSRIMYAGKDTLLAVPVALDRFAKSSWLLRSPRDGASASENGSGLDEEDSPSEESFDALQADSQQLSTHFLHPRSVRLQFFRITQVTPAYLGQNGFYFSIDPLHTQLKQEGNCDSRVPYALESFLANYAFTRNRSLVHMKQAVPSAMKVASTLNDVFQQMYALFLPTLHHYAKNAAVAAATAAALAHTHHHHHNPALLSPSPHPSAASTFALQSTLLLTGPRRSHKRKLCSAVATSLGLHYTEVNFFDLLSDQASESLIVKNIQNFLAQAQACAPILVHFRRVGALKTFLSAQQKEHDSLITSELTLAFQQLSSAAQPVLIVASGDNLASIPTSFRNLFIHSLALTPPGLDQRAIIVKESIGALSTKNTEEAKVSEPNSKDTPAKKIEGEELVEAAAEMSSIETRSHLTSSPPPASSTSTAAAATGLPTPASLSASKLASLLAAKTAGLNVGDVEFLLASAARVAVERAMLQDRTQKEEEEKIRVAEAEKSSLSVVANGDDEKKQPADDHKESTAIVPYSGVSAAAQPSIVAADIESALSAWSARSSAQTGTISSVPNVKWSDVGGLENVKKEVMEAIELPLKFPHLFSAGIKKRAGLLLYGPPGTGKTMIAKAVATECNLNFMSVKGPELLNMYIGESEKNVRDVFARARNAKPVVIFFDELDALAPNRGQGSDSGGVMDRVVSALLAELDGVAANEGVFVVAATNRPDLIEAGLLRPGRLDRCVYLGVSETRDQQLNILAALTRKFKLDPDVDLLSVVSKCTYTMSGADFYALASDALLLAIKRQIQYLEGKFQEKLAENKANAPSSTPLAMSPVSDTDVELTPSVFMASLPPSELAVLVSQSDFLAAQAKLKPSLDEAQLKHYKELQKKFSETHSGGEGHAKPASSAASAPSPAPVSSVPPPAASSTSASASSSLTNTPATTTSAYSSSSTGHLVKDRVKQIEDHEQTETATPPRNVGSELKPAVEKFRSPALVPPPTAALQAAAIVNGPSASSSTLSKSSLPSISDSTVPTTNSTSHPTPLADTATAAPHRATSILEWERSSFRSAPSSTASSSVVSSFSAYANDEPASTNGHENSSNSSDSIVSAPKAAASARPLKPWEKPAAAAAEAPLPQRPLKPWERAAAANAAGAAPASQIESVAATNATAVNAAPVMSSSPSLANSTAPSSVSSYSKSFRLGPVDPILAADALENGNSTSASASSRSSLSTGSEGSEVNHRFEQMQLSDSPQQLSQKQPLVTGEEVQVQLNGDVTATVPAQPARDEKSEETLPTKRIADVKTESLASESPMEESKEQEVRVDEPKPSVHSNGRGTKHKHKKSAKK